MKCPDVQIKAAHFSMLAMAGVAEILVGCCLWRTGAVVNGVGGGIA